VSGTPADPAELLDRLKSWLNLLCERQLIDEPDEKQLREVLMRSWGERLDLPGDPLLVAMLCGPTAVGKSSLINALAGAEISRPGLGAATSAGVVYVHEEDDPSRLFEYSEALGQLGREAASLVRHARDELLHKVLVDTPDIDSVVQRHGETTRVLVHCADLVLFVTSPEKYKDMHSARWVAEHREQRAIAFVLNKWDRASFGPQYDRRHLVEQDFRALLAREGFADPLLFKTSALLSSLVDCRDDELPALRHWLEDGLDRSAAAAIQERRRRAAWGRLSARVAPAVPSALAEHRLAREVLEQLKQTRLQAHRMAKNEALVLNSRSNLDRSIRPITPGLLGGWIAARRSATDLLSPLRDFKESLTALTRSRQITRSGPGEPDEMRDFGRNIAALLAGTTDALAHDAEVECFPLGPVRVVWQTEPSSLRRQLNALPAETEANVTERAMRPSFRRFAGIIALFAIEFLLTLVLIITLWRVGSGFISGDYAAGTLIVNAAALVIVLLFLGQLTANLFFPPLRAQLRKAVLRRAESLINRAWNHSAEAFAGQLDAAAHLRQQGRDLLLAIDGILELSLQRSEANDKAQHLFGQGVPNGSKPEATATLAAEDGRSPVISRGRRPRFD
jgi:hypothetical protein